MNNNKRYESLEQTESENIVVKDKYEKYKFKSNIEIPSYKILVVGDSDVGKTSLIKRYIKNEYNKEEESTSDIKFYMKMRTQDPVCVIELWEIPTETNPDVLDLYFRDIDAIVIVTDASRPNTFIIIPPWREFAVKISKQIFDDQNINYDSTQIPLQIPVIIMANKSDKSERVMSADELKDTVKYRKLHAGFLVSAQLDDQIDSVFEFLVRQIQNSGQRKYKDNSKLIESIKTMI